jgi:rhodanese-related sulfurtransferase
MASVEDPIVDVAELVRLLAPASLLRLGSVPPLMADDRVVHVGAEQVAALQLDRRFPMVVIGADVWAARHQGVRREVLHCAQQHLQPGGHLLVMGQQGAEADDLLARGGDLSPVGRGAVGEVPCAVFVRTERFTVHDLLADARAGLQRLDPLLLAAALRSDDPPLVVDTRTPSDRARFGTIEGSVHLPRTVLEWRVDPTNGYLHPAVRSFDQRLVVVCNHGYSSSVAAATLQRLGYPSATDLVGGVHAWRAAGLPVVPPDHTFLEL